MEKIRRTFKRITHRFQIALKEIKPWEKWTFLGALVLVIAGTAGYFVYNHYREDNPVVHVTSTSLKAEDFSSAEAVTVPASTIKLADVKLSADTDGTTSETNFYYIWEPKISFTSSKDIKGVRITSVRILSQTDATRTTVSPSHLLWTKGSVFDTRPKKFDSLGSELKDIIIPALTETSSPYADSVGSREATVSFQALSYKLKAEKDVLSNTLIFYMEVLYADGTKSTKNFAKQVSGPNMVEANNGSFTLSREMTYGGVGQEF